MRAAGIEFRVFGLNSKESLVHAKKLKAAEAEIKAADEAAQTENEYQKLQEAKKGEEPAEEQPQEPAGDEVKQ